MAIPQERAPIERETLIFDNPESAGRFQERVRRRTQEAAPGVDTRRDAVAEELSQEFEAQGEGVEYLRRPWDHTAEEHEETQGLINIAFEKDLSAALREARASGHYPRNIDLLHDTLTHQMYELVQEEKVNKQGMGLWITVAAGILLIGTVIILILIFNF